MVLLTDAEPTEEQIRFFDRLSFDYNRKTQRLGYVTWSHCALPISFELPSYYVCEDQSGSAGTYWFIMEEAIKCGKRIKLKEIQEALGISESIDYNVLDR